VIEHTQVQNGSARFGNPGVRAFDAIVCANCQQAEQRRLAAGFRPAQTSHSRCCSWARPGPRRLVTACR
jgi:hypothetical protein